MIILNNTGVNFTFLKGTCTYSVIGANCKIVCSIRYIKKLKVREPELQNIGKLKNQTEE